MGCGSAAKYEHDPRRGHEQILSAESAGCEARSAEQSADEIRSPLLHDATRPATTLRFSGARFFCASDGKR